jgi:threonine dehydratase
VRNALSVLTSLSEDELRSGVVAATRGNHGLGLAWAGERLGAPVAICVPLGNNPEKNAAIRGLGAELVEKGRDYDESVEVAMGLARDRGMRLVHSTNDALVLAGAGTLALELVEDVEHLDALVIAVGGGSQAVGAITVARAMRPGVRVYGVQAAKASAIHDSWHAGEPRPTKTADTFADGLATRNVYAMTFEALREGLAGFVVATEEELASAVRLLLATTHNLAEGAGAAGVAGVVKLARELEGKCVGVVLSGSNIDAAALEWVLGS